LSRVVSNLTTICESSDHPIKVKCYSGYKANERPSSFIIDVEGSWFEEDEYSRERRACFRVRADDGDLYLLSSDENRNHWVLRRIWKLGNQRPSW
jgi:hypothetical protein